MIGVFRASWALFLGILLLMVGNGLQGSLLGVRASIEGFSPELMGYVMAGYFVGFLGGSQLTPIMLRRVGHIRVFAALGSLISAAFIIYAAVVDPIAWFLMRVLVGFCFSGVYVVAESWINDASTNENRGSTLSLYLMVQMVGVVAGQLMLNIGDPGGYDLFVLISVLVSVSFAPILLSVSPAPFYDASKRMTLRELLDASPLGAVSALMLGGVFGAMFGMGPIYAAETGLSVFEISIFMAAIFAGGVVLQYPLGIASDLYDRRWLIIVIAAAGLINCLLGTAFGGVVVAEVFGFEFKFLYLTGALLGGLTTPLYALIVAHTNDFLERDQMASASGGLVFLNGVGATLGPIATGYLMTPALVGPQGWWSFMSLLFGGMAAYGLYRATQRPTVSAEETSPYAPYAPRATPVVTEMLQEVAFERQEAEAEEAQTDDDDESEAKALEKADGG
ncbi:MAG: MFS transporter [Rhodobacteraceae bacterium]|nr:MFS transporter [Paracoccaceae bacterium]